MHDKGNQRGSQPYSAPLYLLRSITVGALLLVSQLSLATVWNNGTTDDIVYVGPNVGTGDDYVSLSACATAFSGVAGGINANWVIKVRAAGSPYAESASATFGNTIAGGKTVTLRPDDSATVVVNFTLSSANGSGFNSGIIIGDNQIATAGSGVATNGFIIDGSNNGSSSQNMTITMSGSIASTTMNVIEAFGASTGGTVKNCILTNNASVASQNHGCVMLRVRYPGSGALIPDNWTIQSNTINGGTATQARGISCTLSGTAVSGNAISGLTVTNNTISARHGGVWMNQNASATITGNTFQIGPQATQNTPTAIQHAGANGVNGWTILISGNTINKMQYTATTVAGAGPTVMDLSGVPGSGNGTYNVYNNIISGFDYSTATSNDWFMRGISTGSVGANLNAYNNSINMVGSSNVSGATAGRVFAIGATVNNTGTINVKNNIIRTDQTNLAGVFKPNATGTIAVNYNDISLNGTTEKYGTINSVNYTVFGPSGTAGTWQNAGYDLNGQTTDPTATTGSAWASATDLHFLPTTTKPAQLQSAPQVASITTDIDGETRNAGDSTKYYPGADEIPTQPLPVAVSMFNIE